jgi:phospholipid transport system substrate-binding protein
MQNIHRSILVPFILLSVFTAHATSAQQTGDDIRNMLVNRDREIKSLVGSDDTLSDSRKEELRDVINDVIDFAAMGKAALGRHWKKLTPEQRTEFIDVFSRVIRSNSLSDLEVYRSDVTYDDIQISGQKAHVVTTITYKDVPTKVEYDLVYNGSTWVATDIILDEVSTVKGYSRSFQSLIRKKGYDELMKRLRKKLDESGS